MKSILRAVMMIATMTITGVPMQAAQAQRTYYGSDQVIYAKSEVDKATSKCVKSVLGGAILGAGLGALLGGGRGAGLGALGGTAAGATVCAVLKANAKHKDEIIRAQLAAASSADGTYSSSWLDDKGNPVSFTARAGTIRQIDGAKLIPVKYVGTAGTSMASPKLETGGRDCREVASTFGSEKGSMPNQLVCRTASGDYEPYEEAKA